MSQPPYGAPPPGQFPQQPPAYAAAQPGFGAGYGQGAFALPPPPPSKPRTIGLVMGIITAGVLLGFLLLVALVSIA